MDRNGNMIVTRTILFLGSIIFLGALAAWAVAGEAAGPETWFYPAWAAQAKSNHPIQVRDTDSALGRYSLQTKAIGLRDLVLIHGHLCDGLVTSFVELKAALARLFPDRVVDRTDLQVVSKNGPCVVDAAMFMTGAQINFQTLRIDNSIGEGFIVQRISTGEAYRVSLKPGVFPPEQAALEAKLRGLRREGQPVTAADIDRVEEMANQLSRKVLNAPPESILVIERLENYRFSFNDLYGDRGDIINKDMPR